MFFHACAKFLLLLFTLYSFISAQEIQEDEVIEADEYAMKNLNIVTSEPAEVNLKDLDYSYWCKFQYNGYKCIEKVERSRFYYDIKMDDCKTFTYSGCNTKFNNFLTLAECHEHCADAGHKLLSTNTTNKISCRMQPDFGTCDGYHPMWYYDINERACRGFSWSGCGGNFNRFKTQQICTMVCPGVVEY